MVIVPLVCTVYTVKNNLGPHLDAVVFWEGLEHFSRTMLNRIASVTTEQLCNKNVQVLKSKSTRLTCHMAWRAFFCQSSVSEACVPIV